MPIPKQRPIARVIGTESFSSEHGLMIEAKSLSPHKHDFITDRDLYGEPQNVVTDEQLQKAESWDSIQMALRDLYLVDDIFAKFKNDTHAERLGRIKRLLLGLKVVKARQDARINQLQRRLKAAKKVDETGILREKFVGKDKDESKSKSSLKVTHDISEYQVEVINDSSGFTFRLTHKPSKISSLWCGYTEIAALDGICALTAYYVGDVPEHQLIPMHWASAIKYLTKGKR